MPNKYLFPYLLFAALGVDCIIKILWMFNMIWVPVIWWGGTVVAVALALCMVVVPKFKQATDALRVEKPMVKGIVPVWVVASVLSIFLHSPV